MCRDTKIDDLMDQLHGAVVFLNIDLRLRYHQLRIRPSNIPKTSFQMRYSYYDFLVMSFGLTNTLNKCIELMNGVFQSYLNSVVTVFIDDIFVYSNTKADHVRH